MLLILMLLFVGLFSPFPSCLSRASLLCSYVLSSPRRGVELLLQAWKWRENWKFVVTTGARRGKSDGQCKAGPKDLWVVPSTLAIRMHHCHFGCLPVIQHGAKSTSNSQCHVGPGVHHPDAEDTTGWTCSLISHPFRDITARQISDLFQMPQHTMAAHLKVP